MAVPWVAAGSWVEVVVMMHSMNVRRWTGLIGLAVVLGAGISRLAGEDAKSAAKPDVANATAAKVTAAKPTAAERQAAVEKALAAYAQLGYSPDPPATGPQIKTPRGYMAPYKMQIPGTDVSFEMVPIPGGKIKIGSPATESGRQADEGPQFEVEIRPMWVGKHEVTWAEYWKFMSLYDTFKSLDELRTDLADPKKRADMIERYQLDKEFTELGDRLVKPLEKADAITAPTRLYDPSTTYESGEEPNLPAVTMTQYSAKHYTKWLSKLTGQWYRLPSEAEWEYACRAGTTTAYSFGDDAKALPDYAWVADNSDEKSHPVGQKKPNPWGLHDIHGNVSEWVLDEHKKTGYAPFAGKTLNAWDATVWPTVQWPRVLRGGSWLSEPAQARSAARLGSNDTNDDDVGWKYSDPNRPLSPWWYTEEAARGVGFRLVRVPEAFSSEQQTRYWEADVEAVRVDVGLRLKEGRGSENAANPRLPEVLQQLEAVLKRREAAERAKK